MSRSRQAFQRGEARRVAQRGRIAGIAETQLRCQQLTRPYPRQGIAEQLPPPTSKLGESATGLSSPSARLNTGLTSSSEPNPSAAP